MNPYELTALISSCAIIISNSIEDNNELDLLASSFNQLGDTLATISAQRVLLESRISSQNDK